MSMLTVRDLDPEDEPVDLVASIREYFAGTRIALDLPDRTSGVPQPLALGS